MPVENEMKFVLSLNSEFENRMHKEAGNVYFIEQGYLLREKSLTVRLRRQLDRKNKVKHILTVKKKTGLARIIEIEKKISESDFLELKPYADGWLTKTRYVVGHWDVDFFKNGLETYFVMAEIEMPDGVEKPEKLPRFVVDNLLYTVPRDDCRFSSKKLSNVEYAKMLFQEVIRKRKQSNCCSLGELA